MSQQPQIYEKVEDRESAAEAFNWTRSKKDNDRNKILNQKSVLSLPR